jgi:hypothetical protein
MIYNNLIRVPTRDDEICPDRRTLEPDAFDVKVGGILCVEENWSEISIARVLGESECRYPNQTGKTYQNFSASKAIIPCLSVSIQDTRAKDLDVLTTPFPEGN